MSEMVRSLEVFTNSPDQQLKVVKGLWLSRFWSPRLSHYRGLKKMKRRRLIGVGRYKIDIFGGTRSSEGSG